MTNTAMMTSGFKFDTSPQMAIQYLDEREADTMRPVGDCPTYPSSGTGSSIHVFHWSVPVAFAFSHFLEIIFFIQQWFSHSRSRYDGNFD
jgi:hypothetical protein